MLYMDKGEYATHKTGKIQVVTFRMNHPTYVDDKS